MHVSPTAFLPLGARGYNTAVWLVCMYVETLESERQRSGGGGGFFVAGFRCLCNLWPAMLFSLSIRNYDLCVRLGCVLDYMGVLRAFCWDFLPGGEEVRGWFAGGSWLNRERL